MENNEKSQKVRRIYKASTGFLKIDLAEVWHSRELIFILAWREIASQYRVPAMGILWSLTEPLTTGLVSSLFFGKLARMPSDNQPYPLFVFAGLIVWQYFSKVAGASTTAHGSMGSVLKKIYFPRLIIPFSILLPALIDFLIAFIFMLVALLVWHSSLRWTLLQLPIYLALLLLTAIAMSTWISALTMRYIDIRHLVPFFMRLLMLSSPIYYPTSIIPADWRFLYNLNPIAATLHGFRWCLLESGDPPDLSVLGAFGVAGLAAISGMFVFKRLSQRFADVI